MLYTIINFLIVIYLRFLIFINILNTKLLIVKTFLYLTISLIFVCCKYIFDRLIVKLSFDSNFWNRFNSTILILEINLKSNRLDLT